MTIKTLIAKLFSSGDNKQFLNKDTVEMAVYTMKNYDGKDVSVNIYLGRLEGSNMYSVILLVNDPEAEQKAKVYNTRNQALTDFNKFEDNMFVKDAIDILSSMCDRCIYKNK